MSLQSTYQDWLYPELKAFHSHKARQRALAKCSKRLLKDWVWWIFLIGIGVASLLVRHYILLPLAIFLQLVGVPKALGIGILLGVSMVFIVGPILVFSRRQVRLMRQWLRELLAEQGTRICPQCNYDLTGNVSGACPECGERI